LNGIRDTGVDSGSVLTLGNICPVCCPNRMYAFPSYCDAAEPAGAAPLVAGPWPLDPPEDPVTLSEIKENVS